MSTDNQTQNLRYERELVTRAARQQSLYSPDEVFGRVPAEFWTPVDNATDELLKRRDKAAYAKHHALGALDDYNEVATYLRELAFLLGMEYGRRQVREAGCNEGPEQDEARKAVPIDYDALRDFAREMSELDKVLSGGSDRLLVRQAGRLLHDTVSRNMGLLTALDVLVEDVDESGDCRKLRARLSDLGGLVSDAVEATRIVLAAAAYLDVALKGGAE